MSSETRLPEKQRDDRLFVKCKLWNDEWSNWRVGSDRIDEWDEDEVSSEWNVLLAGTINVKWSRIMKPTEIICGNVLVGDGKMVQYVVINWVFAETVNNWLCECRKNNLWIEEVELWKCMDASWETDVEIIVDEESE